MSAKPNDLGRILINRVLRVAEEAGRISDEVSCAYGFDTRGAASVKNRLAHAYGEVDREILWEVISEDFDELLSSCRAYCDEKGLELS